MALQEMLSKLSLTQDNNTHSLKDPQQEKTPKEDRHDIGSAITPFADPAQDEHSPSTRNDLHESVGVETEQDYESSDTDDSINNMLSYVSIGEHQDINNLNSSVTRAQIVEYQTAPIFSYEVRSALDSSQSPGEQAASVFTQYGLLGVCKSTGVEEMGSSMTYTKSTSSKNKLIFANMNAPWSAFICGSQGAGKSHTLSCLLENGLLANSNFNKLPNPLSSIVFHYDKFTGKTSTQLCEAAFLCSSGIPVTVLVSPSNIWAMKELYTNLPGLSAGTPRPKILPLYLSDKNLTTSTMMKLMCADSKASVVPLYIAVVHIVLQEMAMLGHGTGVFSYKDFKTRLEKHHWLRGQRGPLDMRLRLLEAFLEPSEFTRSTRPARASENIWAFEQGSLTIVDLSDPFVDESDACALFSICLGIFMDSRGKNGQVIALDEAHKFLTQTGEAKALTEDLTSIIRQQRHTGTRVLIATQEPTLSPKLMDLANLTIVHRFLSPDWYQTIKRHLAAANRYDGTQYNSLFEAIVGLDTGEALLFCPTAILTVQKSRHGKVVQTLGNDYARIRIRRREATDGGKSIMASDENSNNTPALAVDVPMHVVTRPPSPPRQTFFQRRDGFI